ncbi:YggS family pyridoxal phosphate-dependent enzyme [Petroclostridium sp. X23]|uniref:YggS family pyridoxal phosphate-dependent enzyme n=1 Tax=Petroclostridium sp. X23 TaxID=3045146 RepID=UPI0024ACD5F7|nr:YggS family pyridoxal phosphate-dependent enzyme [Petroclostridium sp. X23]WHH59551.1 YggS family pyridoxal phosphate-dependent enzyme [Petroclostridium sp. X23]
MTDLEKNICNITENISDAAQRSGRKPEDIILVAVTKTVDADMINRAVASGITNIGENKVQEILNKYDKIQYEHVKWHLIGHLQTNKVKYIINKVHMIHSVDSIKLAEEINKRAAKIGRTMDILVQVNVSGEESKYGIDVESCGHLIEQLSQLSNIRVKGLMTIAPLTESPEEVRVFFRKLRQLSIDINKKNYDNINMEYLSMGMTGDYEIAIEEGANIVRIGTAIFGHRQYK